MLFVVTVHKDLIVELADYVENLMLHERLSFHIYEVWGKLMMTGAIIMF